MQNHSKKTVRTFGITSFLNDVGSDMIYPIWPLFVISTGANMAILGFLDGLGDAIVSIVQGISGYLSDKFRKRKIFVWIGYLCSSLSRVGYALSTFWLQLIPFRILDRSGKIRSAPRDAIIADISTNSTRGKNFGLVRAMDNLGAVCGIVFCILFFTILGYRNLFLVAALPTAISALLVIFLIKEKKQPSIRFYKPCLPKILNKNFMLLLILSSLFALGSFSYSFLLIYAKDFGWEITFIPVLYLIFTAIASAFSIPFGKLSDITGRKFVLLLSYGFWCFALSLILLKNYFIIILTFVLYGLHKGSLETVQKAFVTELVPEEYKATSLGYIQMCMGLCALPASLIAGVLWVKINLFTPLYLSLILTILSITMLIFVKEKS